MSNSLSFRQWLRKRRNDQNPIGDLARDAHNDPAWPRGPGSLARYEAYLLDQNACDGAVDALRTAWHLYEAETTRREAS